MHQKTVYTIISLQLKERMFMSQASFISSLYDYCKERAYVGGPKTKEKNAILLSLMVMMMILKMANECTEIFVSFKLF